MNEFNIFNILQLFFTSHCSPSLPAAWSPFPSLPRPAWLPCHLLPPHRLWPLPSNLWSLHTVRNTWPETTTASQSHPPSSRPRPLWATQHPHPSTHPPHTPTRVHWSKTTCSKLPAPIESSSHSKQQWHFSALKSLRRTFFVSQSSSMPTSIYTYFTLSIITTIFVWLSIICCHVYFDDSYSTIFKV